MISRPAIGALAVACMLSVGGREAKADQTLCHPPVERPHSPDTFRFNTISKDLSSHTAYSSGSRFVCVKNLDSRSPVQIFWPLVMSIPHWVYANSQIELPVADPYMHRPRSNEPLQLAQTCLMYGALGNALLAPLHVLPNEIVNNIPIDSSFSWCDRLYKSLANQPSSRPQPVAPPAIRGADLPQRKIDLPFRLFFPLDVSDPTKMLMQFSGSITSGIVRTERGAFVFTSFDYSVERMSDGLWAREFPISLIEGFTLIATFDEMSGRDGALAEKEYQRRPIPLRTSGGLTFDSAIALDAEVAPYRAQLSMRDGAGNELIRLPFYTFQSVNR